MCNLNVVMRFARSFLVRLNIQDKIINHATCGADQAER